MKLIAKGWVCPAILVALLLVVASMLYKFIVAGSTEKGEDGRVAVVLTPAERGFVLLEMRNFVGGLQLIASGLSRNDMESVAKAARAMGMATAQDAPLALAGKLPLEFKTLGFGVHREFDTLAQDAERLGDSKHVLVQLSDILQKCEACHASFQIRIEAVRSQAGP